MISDAAIARVASREAERFRAANRQAFAHHAAATGWFQSVPFHWMRDWPSPVPIVAASAKHATLTSIDGQRYDDFCLGDTASLFGHSPPALAAALAKQAGEGLSYMLPTERGAALSQRLAAMFGLEQWQVTTTASEANRAVIRWCRGISGRPKILTFNGAYHGAVDDAFVDLKGGAPAMRASLVGQVHDLRDTTTAIEFNDEAALATALCGGDVACVLAEPVMTNVGMVRDAPGFLATLRRLCDETGTLLIFDETHTISSGYGGHGVTHGPTPDLIVVGKSIGGGVPCAVYGFSAAVADRMAALNTSRPSGHSGIGTTLSANALAITAMDAMLSDVIMPAAYDHMLRGAARLVAGLEQEIATANLDWHVMQVGARVEFLTCPTPPRNGGEAKAAMHPKLEAAIHLFLATRGILLAPFHNMMLVSPVTSDEQIDRLVDVFADCVRALKE
ncbi:aminotransferase [Sphingopyxis sp. H038]|uniref:aspartate aminotransferase family protein n=1 Tax=unclassified Sphingopyxis TaxID=2614943 RepID=UPI000730A05F|nr:MULTISPECIES: aspartate aminotransferase family protein [unclassified Sphingopyxis]KTE02120.1 aminotransferase [Sphingopyxis sp. H012]KTE09868.1 aminotransferase [Sphingopyxis sp. H053]KTE15264.1 aminotransferase [Sphingopyxis sp. H093]KTE29971.1 aminotransferase [Sphingopyxis sp. H080]KTE33687.1 aminotransferase [Sphingopyxis sp. H038]